VGLEAADTSQLSELHEAGVLNTAEKTRLARAILIERSPSLFRSNMVLVDAAGWLTFGA